MRMAFMRDLVRVKERGLGPALHTGCPLRSETGPADGSHQGWKATQSIIGTGQADGPAIRMPGAGAGPRPGPGRPKTVFRSQQIRFDTSPAGPAVVPSRCWPDGHVPYLAPSGDGHLINLTIHAQESLPPTGLLLISGTGPARARPQRF